MSLLFPRASTEEITDLDWFLKQDKERFKVDFKLSIKHDLTVKHFELLELLGVGSFGKVFLAKFKTEEKSYALKVMQKRKLVDSKQVEHTWYEKRILQAVNFPFVIYLEYYFQDNSNIYFAMPYIMGGELFNLIKKLYKLDEELSKFYAVQIVLAIEYLHYLDLVYRDLKPENLLIDDNGYLKLTDMGFCKKISGRTYTLCGTPEYLAPELLQNAGYGFSVDWWSLGVLIYEMNFGRSPFQHWDHLILYENITSGTYTVPSHFSRNLRDLLQNLLQVDFTKRLGCLQNGTKDIKDHRWFTSINWTQILNRHVVPPFMPRSKKLNNLSHQQKFSNHIFVNTENEFSDIFDDM